MQCEKLSEKSYNIFIRGCSWMNIDILSFAFRLTGAACCFEDLGTGQPSCWRHGKSMVIRKVAGMKNVRTVNILIFNQLKNYNRTDI